MITSLVLVVTITTKDVCSASCIVLLHTFVRSGFMVVKIELWLSRYLVVIGIACVGIFPDNWQEWRHLVDLYRSWKSEVDVSLVCSVCYETTHNFHFDNYHETTSYKCVFIVDHLISSRKNIRFVAVPCIDYNRDIDHAVESCRYPHVCAKHIISDESCDMTTCTRNHNQFEMWSILSVTI
jgi:hypothetical protein